MLGRGKHRVPQLRYQVAIGGALTATLVEFRDAVTILRQKLDGSEQVGEDISLFDRKLSKILWAGVIGQPMSTFPIQPKE